MVLHGVHSATCRLARGEQRREELQILPSMDGHSRAYRPEGLLDLLETASAMGNLAVEICVKYLIYSAPSDLPRISVPNTQ